MKHGLGSDVHDEAAASGDRVRSPSSESNEGDEPVAQELDRRSSGGESDLAAGKDEEDTSRNAANFSGPDAGIDESKYEGHKVFFPNPRTEGLPPHFAQTEVFSKTTAVFTFSMDTIPSLSRNRIRSILRYAQESGFQSIVLWGADAPNTASLQMYDKAFYAKNQRDRTPKEAAIEVERLGKAWAERCAEIIGEPEFASIIGKTRVLRWHDTEPEGPVREEYAQKLARLKESNPEFVSRVEGPIKEKSDEKSAGKANAAASLGSDYSTVSDKERYYKLGIAYADAEYINVTHWPKVIGGDNILAFYPGKLGEKHFIYYVFNEHQLGQDVKKVGFVKVGFIEPPKEKRKPRKEEGASSSRPQQAAQMGALGQRYEEGINKVLLACGALLEHPTEGRVMAVGNILEKIAGIGREMPRAATTAPLTFSGAENPRRLVTPPTPSTKEKRELPSGSPS